MKCQNFSIALANIDFQSLQGPLNSHKYIHVSFKPGFSFTVFLCSSSSKDARNIIIHKALPISLHPMNKYNVHKRLVKFMCNSILGNIKSSLQY